MKITEGIIILATAAALTTLSTDSLLICITLSQKRIRSTNNYINQQQYEKQNHQS